MAKQDEAPAEIDEKTLDAAGAGSGDGYVLTQVEHPATAQGREVRHRNFAVVDRTQL